MNRPPWGGGCALSHESPAVALSTPVTIASATTWTDDADDLPLTFSFAYALQQADGTLGAVRPLGSSTLERIYVWGAPMGGTLEIYCRARDALNATASVATALEVEPLPMDADRRLAPARDSAHPRRAPRALCALRGPELVPTTAASVARVQPSQRH